MKFLTSRRFNILDSCVFALAIMTPHWFYAICVIVVGAVISSCLETLYGTN